jgi:RNA polymerase sigma factor (sigma-70 family)
MEPVKVAEHEQLLGEESDEILLSYMSLRDTNLSAAQDAWREFYNRHLRYIFWISNRICRGILDDSAINDLVQDVFIRAYERAETFKGGGLRDPEKLQHRARAWLGTIAKHILMDILRSRSGVSTINLEQKDLENLICESSDSESDSPQMRLLQTALSQLSENEQYVLRVTFQWYELGKQQRLPNDVAADLAKALNTTSANIRQIRRRALQKIEQIIKMNSDS